MSHLYFHVSCIVNSTFLHFQHKSTTKILFGPQTTWTVKANHAGMFFWLFLSSRQVVRQEISGNLVGMYIYNGLNCCMSAKSLPIRAYPCFPSVLTLDGVAFATRCLQEVVAVSVALMVVVVVFVVAALAFKVETCEEINSPGGLLGVTRISSVNLISLTLPEYNSNDHCDHSIIQQYYFCKRGPKYFAYIILRFSFFSSCEKDVFISEQ